MATITYKCPNCGGGLRFDPKTQKFKCDFCLSIFTQDQLDQLSPDTASDQMIPKDTLTQGLAVDDGPGQDQTGGQDSGTGQPETSPGGEGQPGDGNQAAGPDLGRDEAGEAVVYTCPSCGASVIADANTAATFCYYCHNPIVLEGRLRGKYLPDRVIPFRVAKKEAQQAFLAYVRKKHFVPKNFFGKDQIEKLSGVYYPFWVYDTSMEGQLEGRADRIRTWISGDREFTETSVYQVERTGRIRVQNLSQSALADEDRNLIRSVMPFRLGAARPFQMSVLQGFVAQRRDVEADQIADGLKGRAQAYAKSALEQTLQGYTAVTRDEAAFKAEEETFSYMLLPLWLMTYKGRDGKRYFFAMNGQTGETHGYLPVDYVRLTAFAGILAGLVFALTLALLYFLA